MNKTFIFLTLAIITLSCSKENFDVNNLNGNKVSAFGHGGMGTRATYPINSFESLSKCLNLGADGTELDVQMTKDSILIAFHDVDLSENTTFSGLVSTLNWSEISEARYKNPMYSSYSIITLDQFFSNTKNLSSYDFTFDCKLNPGSNSVNEYNQRYVNAIDRIINKFGLINNTYLESHDESFLKLLQLKNSNNKLFINPSSFDNGLEVALRLNLFGITMSSEDITKDQIEIAHDNNLFIAIWGVRTKSSNSEGIRKNPDFIQSDRVKNLIDLVN